MDGSLSPCRNVKNLQQELAAIEYIAEDEIATRLIAPVGMKVGRIIDIVKSKRKLITFYLVITRTLMPSLKTSWQQLESYEKADTIVAIKMRNMSCLNGVTENDLNVEMMTT